MFQWIGGEASVRLLDDIRRANAGEFDVASFSDAPLLDAYNTTVGYAYALTGMVNGHPRLKDGKEIVTSQLYYLNSELGIARTMNRWYRLGTCRQGRGH
ncbi:DUF6634 family protein [Rhizobium binae]|uniref:DUF6634 family protein n=1 Tax=Rhizobium binae TaxID=1138190 RepID=UPI003DA99D3B